MADGDTEQDTLRQSPDPRLLRNAERERLLLPIIWPANLTSRIALPRRGIGASERRPRWCLLAYSPIPQTPCLVFLSIGNAAKLLVYYKASKLMIFVILLSAFFIATKGILLNIFLTFIFNHIAYLGYWDGCSGSAVDLQGQLIGVLSIACCISCMYRLWYCLRLCRAFKYTSIKFHDFYLALDRLCLDVLLPLGKCVCLQTRACRDALWDVPSEHKTFVWHVTFDVGPTLYGCCTFSFVFGGLAWGCADVCFVWDISPILYLCLCTYQRAYGTGPVPF